MKFLRQKLMLKMAGIKDKVSHTPQESPTKGNRATMIWGTVPLKMALSSVRVIMVPQPWGPALFEDFMGGVVWSVRVGREARAEVQAGRQTEFNIELFRKAYRSNMYLIIT